MIGEICKYKSHIYYNNICIVTVTFNGEDYIIYKSGDFTCNCNDTFYLFIDNYDKLNIINVQNFFESRVNIFYVSKGYTFYEGNRYRCNYSGDGFIIVEDFEKTTYKIKFKGRFKK